MKYVFAKNNAEKTFDVMEVAVALYTVNRHAKCATDPHQLYNLKTRAIGKLLKEGEATKVGLHFSPNPKTAYQRSDVLVKVGEYHFHIPPSKEDFKTLPHLGNRNPDFRNPKRHMSNNQAKSILKDFIAGGNPNVPKDEADKKIKTTTRRSKPKKVKSRVNNQLRSNTTYLS